VVSWLAGVVTRIDRTKIAQVLAEHSDGVVPSMIARKPSVGCSAIEFSIHLFT
jgi:hypothetical protein